MGLFSKIKNVFSKSKDEEVKKYDSGLEKTRKEFTTQLSNLSRKYKNISDDYFEELEDILIMADIGVNTVMKFVDKLRNRVKSEKITDSNYLKEVIIDELFIMYVSDNVIDSKIHYNSNGPTVILFVGVNGVGKTTTIGKLASQLINDGKKVMLVAGDTFRAGAIEQLKEWGDRINASVVSSSSKDPSSVIYDGAKQFAVSDFDIMICDTAGRLHNKKNLMEELAKINRIIAREATDANVKSLLIIDATTGQNAVLQTEAFSEAVDLDYVGITKLDGSAKGGVAISVAYTAKVPIVLAGLGEGVDDLMDFDPEAFVDSLLAKE